MYGIILLIINMVEKDFKPSVRTNNNQSTGEAVDLYSPASIQC